MMAVYFMPKNHLITKAANLRNLPNKWTPKWMPSARRNLSNKTINTVGTTNAVNQPIHPATYGQQSSKKKGKLSKLKSLQLKWSWKAGASWTIISVLDWWLLAVGWFTLSGLLTRWTPIGVCVLAALDWHYHTRKLEREGLPITASKLQTVVYCSLPLRLMSRTWGWLASCPIPTPLRPVIYGAYINVFKVNMDEAQNPELKDYRSISEFFTRSLKADARKVDDSIIVSPADGKVLHFGSATSSEIEQVKGITYSLESFLGQPSWTDKRDVHSCAEAIKHNKDTALYQCVIYLAPGDYHRFHSPAKWEPHFRRHFTGQLLSVSPKIAQWLPGLFCLNERALYVGKWDHGFFSFTAVGATNVGSVEIYFDDELKTNQYILGPVKRRTVAERTIPQSITLDKGELVGQFNMGSTIVLIFEAPKNFEFTIVPGQQIKFGEKLGEIRNSTELANNDMNMK